MKRLLSSWQHLPLYLRTLIGMVIGAVLGFWLKEKAVIFSKPCSVLMGLVQLLAAPIAFFSIMHALTSTKIQSGKTSHLIRLLITNTIVAIIIGISVTNILKPGERKSLSNEQQQLIMEQKQTYAKEITQAEANAQKSGVSDKFYQILEKLPRSVLGPFTDNGSVIGVIVLALLLGLALRQSSQHLEQISIVLKTLMEAFITMLHWIVELVPLIVAGVVAKEVGVNGFSSFISLIWLVMAVLIALGLQFIYYMTRIQLQSWVSPKQLIQGCKDALVMAFSTASSTATMPVTYECLEKNVGVRKESANLGALVGANFNNDGTALYEAMAALFIAQLLGIHLGFGEQLTVVLCAVAASVGAAGIPSAGLITMTLVFTAVGLPLEYTLLLIPVDWFLDRFRTMINVSGDLCVACVLDGKTRPDLENSSINI